MSTIPFQTSPNSMTNFFILSLFISTTTSAPASSFFTFYSDFCTASFHISCLNSPLSKIPKGEWKCDICVVENNESKKVTTRRVSSSSSSSSSSNVSLLKFVVGSRIKVFWENDNQWFYGYCVQKMKKGQWKIKYDDGDERMEPEIDLVACPKKKVVVESIYPTSADGSIDFARMTERQQIKYLESGGDTTSISSTSSSF